MATVEELIKPLLHSPRLPDLLDRLAQHLKSEQLARQDFCDVVYFGPPKAANLTPDTIKVPVPDLAVEVLSSSMEDRDRGVTFEDFAINGVEEYWIIDADTPTIEPYVLVNAAYERRVKSSSGQIRSVAIPGLEFQIDAMFDEQKNLDALRRIMA